MYPNQQPGQTPWQQPPQAQQPQPAQLQPLPADFDGTYLDTIAAKPVAQTASPLVLWGMIGGVLLVVIMFFFMFASGGGAPTKTERLASFQERTRSLKTLISKNNKLIKSSQLRASSANLSSILTGMDAEATAYKATITTEKKKDSKKATPVSKEYVVINEKLNEARLNVALDDAYANQVANQIAQLRSEMSIVYKEAKSSDYKEKLSADDAGLKKLQADFLDFKG